MDWRWKENSSAFQEKSGKDFSFHENVTFSIVIPGEAEGSAVPRTSPGNADSRRLAVASWKIK
jgi:hypothetical protein